MDIKKKKVDYVQCCCMNKKIYFLLTLGQGNFLFFCIIKIKVIPMLFKLNQSRSCFGQLFCVIPKNNAFVCRTWRKFLTPLIIYLISINVNICVQWRQCIEQHHSQCKYSTLCVLKGENFFFLLCWFCFLPQNHHFVLLNKVCN